MIERFFRSLKEEGVWLQRFSSYAHSRRVITRRLRGYNDERPHQSLGYLSPVEYRPQQLAIVA